MIYLPIDRDGQVIPALRLKENGAHAIAVSGASERNIGAFDSDTRAVSIYATVPVYLILAVIQVSQHRLETTSFRLTPIMTSQSAETKQFKLALSQQLLLIMPIQVQCLFQKRINTGFWTSGRWIMCHRPDNPTHRQSEHHAQA